MNIEEQIQEVLAAFPDSKLYSEGGFDFMVIPEIELPSGCNPGTVKGLLCYQPRDGYQSRLFVSSVITGCPQKNWSAMNVRLLDQNWFAVSWQTEAGLTVFQMLMAHINAFQHD